MNQSTPANLADRTARTRWLPSTSVLTFGVAIAAILLISWVSLWSQQVRTRESDRLTGSLHAIQRLDELMSTLKDAETGQRGFLLTGDENYLEPYSTARAALEPEFERLGKLLASDPDQLQRLQVVHRIAEEKMAELAQTVALRRAGNAAAADALVNTSRGKITMDRLRELLSQMEGLERVASEGNQKNWQAAADLSGDIAWGGSALLLFLIGMAAVTTSRDYRARATDTWIRTGLSGLMERIAGDPTLHVLGANALDYTARSLDAHVGALYLAESDGSFRRVAAYAMPETEGMAVVRSGEGLLGQAARRNALLRVSEIPDGYLYVVSGVGRAPPREVLIAPAGVEGDVLAVMELGFFRRLDEGDCDFFERLTGALGVAVRSARDRSRLEELLEETQRQSEELQAQQEELRVSNEELEEQGRVLRESQVQLESQQSELEQTNAQLEEQAQQMEIQRDDLASSQAVLARKADELQRADRYKSEFLANMSHELRTPLNSTLILAKLLADNKNGNLDVEQVKYAQTISSAGQDLLALINDILDLAKIESGNVEVRTDTVAIARVVESLEAVFAPMAAERGLGFRIEIDPDAPERIETDSQRLEQILKNLLSNAMKFTEAGEVMLRVFSDAVDNIGFAVRDTGIGIPAAQQAIVFEAFRQADGSTHRRYGGTGLGLSISRDLARLLGGEIALGSVPGQGSTFTLTIPRCRAPAPSKGAVPAAPESSPAVPASASQPQPARPRSSIAPAVPEDDRDRLAPELRLILVIEDDERFAAILRDLAHEMGFQCVIAHTAGDGLAAASSYRPSAILLDMNLPDHSGLGVLDRLKRDPLTRHIPVHVASVADYSQEARELGAIGYVLKPVKREQLVEALRKLEHTFSQSLRRVLVVEDDARQRESIRQLLAGADVEIIAAANAGEALRQLDQVTFDCMVMDLRLPDMSGFDLLEKMAEQEHVAFPPVIVYTGRSLTPDEEQRLRRHSHSIIVKDARSPERLLDEVTLFLHQVESRLPPESQRMLQASRSREAALEGRRVLVVEDDVRNIFALSSVLEPKGVKVEIARNGREAIAALERSVEPGTPTIDLVLMDIMMPEMDGLTAMREIRKRAEFRRLPIIALTAKAMRDDQEKCLAAGANDYIAKPLDVEKLLSLVRVWMPKH